MGLEHVAEFKQFLFENFSNVGAIALITTICVLVLSLAMREVFSWFTKTDKLRKEMQSLKSEIKFLQSDIKILTDKISSNPSANIMAVENQDSIKKEASPTKASSFPLNH